MPRFLSDAEFSGLREHPEVLAARADEHIHRLELQVEEQKARADAAAISAEQTCSLLEQRYLSLASEHSGLEEEKRQLAAALAERAKELADVKAQAQQQQLDAIKKENDLERLKVEVSELKKTNDKLLELLGQKDAEIQAKNAAIKSYLDKIVRLTDERTTVEAKVHQEEAERGRLQSANARLQQEKELLKSHSDWLDSELRAKSQGALEEHRAAAEREADLTAKLDAAEKAKKDALASSSRAETRCRELENAVSSLQQKLKDAKDMLSSQEDLSAQELETSKRLTKLYEDDCEDWKNKCKELKGILASLQEHMDQEKAKLEEAAAKEAAAREACQKKLEDATAEFEKKLAEAREGAASERTRLYGSNPEGAIVVYAKPTGGGDVKLVGDFRQEEPAERRLVLELSPTALASMLIREGMTLTSMYARYTEAAEAWRHEKHARKKLEDEMKQIYFEIERRAPMILNERAQFTEMEKAYNNILKQNREAASKLKDQERRILHIQADLKRTEHEKKALEDEMAKVQHELACLMKDRHDYQRRAGSGASGLPPAEHSLRDFDELLAVKSKLVLENAQLRDSVQQEHEGLRAQLEIEKAEMVDKYSKQVEKMTGVLQSNQARVKQLEQQLVMYQTLWEDTRSRSATAAPALEGLPGDRSEEYRVLYEKTQKGLVEVRSKLEAEKKAIESLLDEAKSEARAAEVQKKHAETAVEFERDRCKSLIEQAHIQTKEVETLRVRNLEFAVQMTEHQRLMRAADHARADAEDRCRKLELQVDCLEKEKSLLASAEARASEQAHSLSLKVQELQGSLNAAHASQQALQEINAAERQRLLEDYQRLQREWAESQRQREVVWGEVRSLKEELEKERGSMLSRLQEAEKTVQEARLAASTAQTQEKVAQARVEQLEGMLKKADDKLSLVLAHGKRSRSALEGPGPQDEEEELLEQLTRARAELVASTEDLEAAKQNSEEFKKIAEMNETALREIGAAHEQYKAEVARAQEAAASEAAALRVRVEAAETELKEKRAALEQAAKEKEQAVEETSRAAAALKEDLTKTRQSLEAAEERNASLKADVARQQQLWREAQSNYERQVMLLADNIKELGQTSGKLRGVEEEMHQYRSRAETAEQLKMTAEVAWLAEKAALETAKDEAEKRQKELEDQNRKLLNRLESAHSTPTPGHQARGTEGSQAERELDEVLVFMRREKEMAEMKLHSALLERDRWKVQAEHAGKAAEEARAQVRIMQERARGGLQSAEEHQAMLAQLQQLNLLRESNTVLRQENEHNLQQAKEWRERVSRAEATVESLTEKLKDKEADLDAAMQAVDVKQAEVERWKKRIEQLSKKYSEVDPGEAARLKDDLAALEAQLKGEAEAAKAAIAAAQEAQQAAEARLAEAEKAVEAKAKQNSELEARNSKIALAARRIRESNEGLKQKLTRMEEEAAKTQQVPPGLGPEGRRVLRSSAEVEQLKQAAAAAEEAEKKAQAELEKVKKDVEALLKEVETLRKDKEAAAASTKTDKQQVERMKNMIKTSAANLNQHKEAKAKLEADLLAATTQRDALQMRVAELESQLSSKRPAATPPVPAAERPPATAETPAAGAPVAGAATAPEAAALPQKRQRQEPPAAALPALPTAVVEPLPAVMVVAPAVPPVVPTLVPPAAAQPLSAVAVPSFTAGALTSTFPAVVAKPEGGHAGEALAAAQDMDAEQQEVAAVPTATQVTEIQGEGPPAPAEAVVAGENAPAEKPPAPPQPTRNGSGGRGGRERARREVSVTSGRERTAEELRTELMRQMAQQQKTLEEQRAAVAAKSAAAAAAKALKRPLPTSAPAVAQPAPSSASQAVTPSQRPNIRLKRPAFAEAVQEQEAGVKEEGGEKRPPSPEAPAVKRTRREAEAPPAAAEEAVEAAVVPPVEDKPKAAEVPPLEEAPQAEAEPAAAEAVVEEGEEGEIMEEEAAGVQEGMEEEATQEIEGGLDTDAAQEAEVLSREGAGDTEMEMLEGTKEPAEDAPKNVEEAEEMAPEVEEQPMAEEEVLDTPKEGGAGEEEAAMQEDEEQGAEGGEGEADAEVEGLPGTEAELELDLAPDAAAAGATEEVEGEAERKPEGAEEPDMADVKGEGAQSGQPAGEATAVAGNEGEEKKEYVVHKEEALAPPGAGEDKAEGPAAAPVGLEGPGGVEEASPQAPAAIAGEEAAAAEGGAEGRRTRSAVVSTAKAFVAAKAKASMAKETANEGAGGIEEPSKEHRIINLGEKSRKEPIQKMPARLQPDAAGRGPGGRGRGTRGGRGAALQSPTGRGRRGGRGTGASPPSRAGSSSGKPAGKRGGPPPDEPTPTSNPFDALNEAND